jgi:hypothetical protein
MKVRRSASMLLALLCVVPRLFAAEKGPDCGRNAALRYWMAFALMENPAADSEVAKRMARMAEGLEPWDDSLAPILDGNAEALATMHRGSRIGFCQWGFEHERLAAAPIAHVARARALARLNILHGMRLLKQGRNGEAIDAWLAGVRFSRDVAADGPWLSALVAGGGLRVHFEALARAARDGGLDTALRQRIQREVAALDVAGFDWSVAARHESEGISATAGVLESTRALNDALRPALVGAFRMPHERSREAVRDLDARAGKDPALAAMWPSAVRANEARGEVVKARAALLALVR